MAAGSPSGATHCRIFHQQYKMVINGDFRRAD
jgi:hypothetical protein